MAGRITRMPRARKHVGHSRRRSACLRDTTVADRESGRWSLSCPSTPASGRRALLIRESQRAETGIAVSSLGRMISDTSAASASRSGPDTLCGSARCVPYQCAPGSPIPRACLASSIFEPQGCRGPEATAAPHQQNRLLHRQCTADEALHIVVERYYGIVDDPLPLPGQAVHRKCIEDRLPHASEAPSRPTRSTRYHRQPLLHRQGISGRVVVSDRGNINPE